VCNSWLHTFLVDITDGNVWKEVMAFISPERQATNVLGFLINVDRFQPYKHIAYSVGVTYAVTATRMRM